MDGTRFKIGETVVTADSNTPRKVTAVMVAYRLTLPGHPDGPGSDFYYQEKDVLPYTPPLAVGDRVRTRWSQQVGVVELIKGDKAAVWTGKEWHTSHIDNCERIPTEVGK